MTELKRIIKAGWVNFTRNGLVSFAAVLVVTITLSFITSIIILQSVLFFSLNSIKDKVDITIYFNVGAPEDKILALKDAIAARPEVSDVVYTSDKDALAFFRTRHQNDYPTIAALDEIGTNPLGGYLNIKAKDISQYDSISNFLKSDNPAVTNAASSIEKINYNQNKLVIDRLNALIAGGQRLGFLITLILVFISIIITFNTIRLAIYISRDEIGVMRLVGASKMYVRGPFMVAGVIYGIIATVITMILFLPVSYWLGVHMTNFFGFNIYNYYTSNIFQIFIINLLFGGFLGIVSSFLAVRKYLNK